MDALMLSIIIKLGMIRTVCVNFTINIKPAVFFMPSIKTITYAYNFEEKNSRPISGQFIKKIKTSAFNNFRKSFQMFFNVNSTTMSHL